MDDELKKDLAEKIVEDILYEFDWLEDKRTNNRETMQEIVEESLEKFFTEKLEMFA